MGPEPETLRTPPFRDQVRSPWVPVRAKAEVGSRMASRARARRMAPPRRREEEMWFFIGMLLP